jgi:hypothetical protein
MRPTLLCTESPAGLSRRVPSAALVLAAVVMLAAELARGQAPATIYHATLQEPNQKTPEVSTAALRQIPADQSAIVFRAPLSGVCREPHSRGSECVGQTGRAPVGVCVRRRRDRPPGGC